MIAVINGREYVLNTSFETLLRYRAKKGVSFLEASEGYENQLELIYLAIDGPRPFYHLFEAAAGADTCFKLTAAKFMIEVVHNPEEKEQIGGSREKFCEYKVLAMYSRCGLPPHLLRELPLSGVLAAIKACYEMNETGSPHEMTPEERKGFYGITPTQEARIEAYLDALCESEG